VYIINRADGQWNRQEGDAIATQLPGLALGVQVADCLPVLLADPVTQSVAAIHSGWRGTLSGVAVKAVEAMQAEFRCDPANLLAAVGPGIRNCCFEVGSEVAARFEKEFGNSRAQPIIGQPDKFLLDLAGALDIQFRRAGMKPENCFDLSLCTRCNANEFFSYRGEGSGTGRMMAVIGRAL